MKTKIYFAAPLFTAAEIMWNSQIAEELRKMGFTVALPQEVESKDPRSTFKINRNTINHCNVVVAVLDGADPDSGTSWEVGYAYANRIPVVAIRTDFRSSGDLGGRYNLMLTESASSVIISLSNTPLGLALKISTEIKRLEESK